MPFRSAVNLTSRITVALLAAMSAVSTALAEVEFDCVVQPNRFFSIGSPVTGILSEVFVARGDRVTEGQVLAQLEAKLEAAAVALNELRASDTTSINAQLARLRLAQERMARASELLARGATTQEVFDQATAELEVSSAELERLKVQQSLAGLELDRAQAALARRTIRSPIDGVVAARRLSKGEFVTQEAWIVRLAALDPLFVEAFLPVAYFDQLAVGHVAVVTLRQPAETRLDAEVTVVDSVFDATSNTFGVRLALSNPDGSLPAGQRCRVYLNVEKVNRAPGELGLD